jgi:tetrapyrrole methylase family protein/MazG family protein
MSLAFDQLISVMERLRGASGCPWDKEQTRESLKPFLIEEAYEVLDAIDSKNKNFLCEELGDLMFQVVFHAQVAKENGEFEIEDILKMTIDKMTRRHPHVFLPKATESLTSGAAIGRWEEIKRKEREPGSSALDGVPKELPALLRAHQVQAKAGRVGFDWKTPEAAFFKIEEETREVKEALATGNHDALEAELGDLLFSIVNVSRLLKVNPEEALRKMVNRFMARFKKMELAAGDQGMAKLTDDEMNALWEMAKKE